MFAFIDPTNNGEVNTVLVEAITRKVDLIKLLGIP